MPFFAKFKSTTQGLSNGPEESGNTKPKPDLYKHIPMHAARDARCQVPPGTRKSDQRAIAEHHKRRSQMQDIYTPAVRLDTRLVDDDWSVGQREVPFVSKQPPTSMRPTASLKELNNINTQRKMRASRRAAHIEPTADVSYHLGLLPSPLTCSTSSTAAGLSPPSIPLPNRRHPPLAEHDRSISSGSSLDQRHAGQDIVAEISDGASRSNSSCGSTQSTIIKSTASTRSSREHLNPAPPRNRARDSLFQTIAQDSRFHKPNSGPRRRLRAAAHDSTGIEQAMASPESFRPHRAPPVIVRNDSAYPVLSNIGFDFGTERPYSPERLRPWLLNSKESAVHYTSMVSAL